jgi:hypothetical protein
MSHHHLLFKNILTFIFKLKNISRFVIGKDYIDFIHTVLFIYFTFYILRLIAITNI